MAINKIKNIFYNELESRLRAGWRILLFFLIMVFLVIVSEHTIDNYLGGLPEDKTMRLFYSVLLAAILGTVSTIIARRYLDRRSFISFGLDLDMNALKDWVVGYFISFAMAAVVFFTMVVFGVTEFQGVNDQLFTSQFLIKFLLMFIMYCGLVAWWEELVFRGFLLQNMISGMGKNLAVIISCLIYGLVHATNDNAGVLSSLIIVLFGYMRLYGYLRTSQLWLSMGMHAGWNFFQGPVFGYATSGYAVDTILVHNLNGPDWLTGGKFGPEGSVITVVVVLLAIGTMYWWTKGRPQIH